MARLIQLRMLTKGPNKNYKKDDLVVVDELRAARLLAERDAEEVSDGNDARLQRRKGL